MRWRTGREKPFADAKEQGVRRIILLGSEMFLSPAPCADGMQWACSNIVTVYTAFSKRDAYAIKETAGRNYAGALSAFARQRLYPEECMFYRASMADALLVVHSLNSLHYDINAQSIFSARTAR
jgi:hypothetical protein